MSEQVLMVGDCLDVMRRMRTNCTDAMVTDPPAGIGFMQRDWDDYRRKHNEADVSRDNVFGRLSRVAPEVGRQRDGFIAMLTERMAEALRVLKPGAHGLVWALPRTSHWTATALEDAGFEVRDVIEHWFPKGYPKSIDLGREIDMERCQLLGRHYDKTLPVESKRQDGDHLCPAHFDGDALHDKRTGLKPASEFWILVRKPLEGTVVQNFLKWGTGVLNVDQCRVGKRWPAHLILSHGEDCVLIGTKSIKANGAIAPHTSGAQRETSTNNVYAPLGGHVWEPHGNGDGTETIDVWRCVEGCPVVALEAQAENSSRFFYVSKPDRRERDAGLEHLQVRSGGEATGREEGSIGTKNPRAGAGRGGGSKNIHPTVKPISLMRYLCRLITPSRGRILDPFAGSGTTGCAAALEDFDCLMIEKDDEAAYAEIVRGRLAHWQRIVFEQQQAGG